LAGFHTGPLVEMELGDVVFFVEGKLKKKHLGQGNNQQQIQPT